MTTLAARRTVQTQPQALVAIRTTRQAAPAVVPTSRPSFLLTLLRALGAPAY